MSEITGEPVSFHTSLPNPLSSSGKRRRQYPDRVGGTWTKYRETVAYFLLLVFLGGPWVVIGGKQIVLLDIPGRQFTIFGATFIPQDFFLLALLLLIAALALFLFSAMFGRIWCGWACPQTVFMESVYRKVERLVEGDFRQQMKRDGAHAKGETPSDYYTVKSTKHIIFIVMSAGFALCFSAYFIGRDDAFALIFSPSSAHPIGFVVFLILTCFMYFVGGFFRELACTVLCPYARLQSVLLDRHSIVVGYDTVRGEPRDKLKHNEERTFGDCIDCHRCIQVCPTGIDIRNGLQLECVNCTACMDACDEVMVKIGRPKGLIRYDSTAALEGEKRKKIIRPRTIIYLVLFAGMFALSIKQLSSRADIQSEILRPPGMPYIKQDDGKIRNSFVLVLQNRSSVPHRVEIQPEGITGAEWRISGTPLSVASGSELRVNVYGIIPASMLQNESTIVHFHILEDGKELAVQKAEFLGPEK